MAERKINWKEEAIDAPVRAILMTFILLLLQFLVVVPVLGGFLAWVLAPFTVALEMWSILVMIIAFTVLNVLADWLTLWLRNKRYIK